MRSWGVKKNEHRLDLHIDKLIRVKLKKNVWSTTLHFCGQTHRAPLTKDVIPAWGGLWLVDSGSERCGGSEALKNKGSFLFYVQPKPACADFTVSWQGEDPCHSCPEFIIVFFCLQTFPWTFRILYTLTFSDMHPCWILIFKYDVWPMNELNGIWFIQPHVWPQLLKINHISGVSNHLGLQQLHSCCFSYVGKKIVIAKPNLRNRNIQFVSLTTETTV